MAVIFAPERRDPNAELKYYMLQMAQLLGGRRKETQQQQQVTEFAKSLMPTQTPSAEGQSVFTPGGAEALKEGFLGGQQTRTGMIQSAQLTPMRIMQKALMAGVPINEAIGLARMAQPKTISPTQQITQKRLNRINKLEAKVRAGTATKAEKKELERKIGPAPLIEFGALPGESKYLTEEERAEKAKKPLNKPLTPTERKGVEKTITEIVPAAPVLPKGIKTGAKYEQEDVEKMWEQTIEETGYQGRGKVARKQIAARFDRMIARLNKGVGIGKLANQYQWDRKKWEAKPNRRPGESIDEFTKRTGL